MAVTRRGVLIGAAAGGGLIAAWALSPRSFTPPLAPLAGEVAFDAWLKIARDGVVTVAVPQLEMGQGISTILPQIIATELGADWRQIAVEPTPPSGAYANIPLAAKWAALWMPLLPELAADPDAMLAKRFAEAERFSATADGMSLAAYEAPCRNAAAAARAVLAMEAASLWDAAWEECEVAGGLVSHGENSAPFGAVAQGAAARTPPDPPPLRPAPAQDSPWISNTPSNTPSLNTHTSLAGSHNTGSHNTGSHHAGAIDFPRLDLPAKVDGSLLFAGDVRLPDMVYAAIRHGPMGQAKLVSFDRDATATHPDIISVVKGKRWLAAIAKTWWQAERGLAAMKPRFSGAGLADSAAIEQALGSALQSGEAHRIAQRGNGDALPEKPQPDEGRGDEGRGDEGRGDIERAGSATGTLTARYDVMAALHGSIETTTATARYSEGRLELWLASQAPEQARQAAAQALNIATENVILYPMPAGGSFDRRLEHDHAIEAALIAREVAQDKPVPVQLVWSRWQEHLAGLPRTPVAAQLTAAIEPESNGTISALSTRIAAPPGALEFGQRLFANKTRWAAQAAISGQADKAVVDGAMPPYTIANASVDHVPTDIALPTARMRGNAHGYTAFFLESFIDEIAHAHQREPLSYRIEMLGNDIRMVTCLQRAAQLAQWDGGTDNSGLGLACHRIGSAQAGGRIACIAKARRDDGGVRVTHIFAAVDIGRIVNHDIASQQIEGGLIFGMGLALGSAVQYNFGLPDRQTLGSLGMPALADCPQIAVAFIPGSETAFDPGELGVAVAAPAIANALHSATGLRFRRLPLLSEGL